MQWIEADLLFANRLADVAATEAMRFFRDTLHIEQKADFSPVTAADHAAEKAMRDLLEKDRPADSIYGEEFGHKRGTSGRLWVLDPIDGTRAFVTGRPSWGTLVALVEAGRPVIGVINAPAARDRWVGCTVGRGRTMLNGKDVQVRPCEQLQQARAASTHPHLFSAAGHSAFQRVGRGVADVLFGGDCTNYGLLAAGQLDLVMEEGLKPYDWAALVPVVEGAGGVITDWQGAPLMLDGKQRATTDGAILAAGDSQVHAAALDRI